MALELSDTGVNKYYVTCCIVCRWYLFLPKTKLVHGHREVARLAGALVGVAVVHGDDVYITEDETVIVILL